MEIGLGLDSTLGLSLNQEAEFSRLAAQLGYTSIWTPEGTGQDSFQLCHQRWNATLETVSGGLFTGIAVCPVMYRTPMAFAMSAGTLSELTDGRFILGIGSGGAFRPAFRQALGVSKLSSISLMRDYLTTVKALLLGEEVNYEGSVVTLREGKLEIEPPPKTPVYLGALGPEMLRLAGEIADGVALNWCSPEQVAWSRKQVGESAAKTGRDPDTIKMIEYIRICVDDDVDLARRALSRSVLRYALGDHVPTERERTLSYRAHFERMGFTDTLLNLDRMRQQNKYEDAWSRKQIPDSFADAVPPELLRTVGYYGTSEGAAEAFRELAQGLDTAIVRVIASQPGPESVKAAVYACRPEFTQ